MRKRSPKGQVEAIRASLRHEGWVGHSRLPQGWKAKIKEESSMRWKGGLARKRSYLDQDGRIYVSHLAALKMMSSPGSGYSPAAIEGLKKADKNLKKVPKNRRDKKEEAVLEPKEASAVGTPETGLDRRGRRERLEKKKMDIWTLANMRDKMISVAEDDGKEDEGEGEGDAEEIAEVDTEERSSNKDEEEGEEEMEKVENGDEEEDKESTNIEEGGAKKEEENEMEEKEEVTVEDKKQSSEPEMAMHIQEAFGEEQMGEVEQIQEVEETVEQMGEVKNIFDNIDDLKTLDELLDCGE